MSMSVRPARACARWPLLFQWTKPMPLAVSARARSSAALSGASALVVATVPVHEAPDAGAVVGGGAEAGQRLQQARIRPGGDHVALLHLDVVALGRTADGLFQRIDEVE